MSTEQIVLRGEMKGHGNWVTSIATTPENPDMILTASRDKTVIVWRLTRDEDGYGVEVMSYDAFERDVAAGARALPMEYNLPPVVKDE